jgi:hypothetical protein
MKTNLVDVSDRVWGGVHNQMYSWVYKQVRDIAKEHVRRQALIKVDEQVVSQVYSQVYMQISERYED